MAKLEGRPGGSTRNSPTFQPLPSLGVAKGQQAAPTSPKPLILPTISTSPPPSSDQIHNRPWPAVYKSALADKNPFVPYSSPTSGASVDLWKKVAKKAELQLHLERNNHRADCNRDHHIIHRLSRRMIPMEKALEKSKATVKQQVKLIQDFKSKMLSASEKTDAEVSYLRHQNEKMQRFLAVAAENRTGQITELEEELRQANSSVGVLKEHMDQIHNIVNDLPADVKKYSTGESEKSCSSSTDRDSVVVAIVKGICHKNEQLEKQLSETDEKLHIVARENERLRKAGEEAARRSKELVNLVASLTEERDMALIRLKETEDIVGSINDLQDIVRSCTGPPDCESPSVAHNRRTPPRHDAISLGSESTPRQTLLWQVVNPKHLVPTEEENPVPLSPAEAEDPTDLSAMRGEPSKTVLYCENMSGEEIRTLGVALVAKLHAAFRALSSKRDSAKLSTANLKKENEALRSTIQEAYDGLKGGKIPESHTPDDYSIALLVAVQEVDQLTEGLRKEKAVLEALKLQQETKIHDLESQTHNLTPDQKVLLGTIQVVKNAVKASCGGHKQMSSLEGFPNRTKVQDESLTELQEMVEKLIQEISQARSNCESFKGGMELKEEELLRLKKLCAQSLDLSKQLQAEKVSLDVQLQDFKENCQFLLQEKELLVQSQARCKLLEEEKDVLERDLQELRKGYQNLKAGISSIEDPLKVCENDLIEMRAHTANTTVDRSAWFDTLKGLKCMLEAANARGESSDVSVNRDDGKEFSGVLDMARQLVEEIKEARSTGETLKERTELKEKELSEVRERFHESISLCVQLQSDIDALEFAMKDLHKSIQCIKVVLDEGMNSLDSEEVERRKIFWKADGLVHEKVVNEVSSILQRLNAAQRSFNEIEEAVGIKVLPGTDLQATAANILTFLKSVKEDRELAYVNLRDVNELLPAVKEHLRCMLDLLAETDSNSSIVAEEYKEYEGTPSIDGPLNFKEVMKSASDLSEVMKVLPSLTQKIRKLKTRNGTLSANLQALELNKLTLTHKSREDQEKLQRLRKSSQLEINHLKQQLNAVECLLTSASSNSTEYRETRLNNSSEGKRGGQIEQTPLLKELVAMRDELCVLRREKPTAGVKAGELALQLVSEQEKVKDVTKVLLMTETRTKTLTNRAIAAEAAVQDLTTQIEVLRKDLTGSKAELGTLVKKLCVQEELLNIEKSKWTALIDEQRVEILRLGGSPMVDPREKMRRADAAEAVKQVLSKYPQASSLRPSKGGYRISPLTFLTTFTVDLLVNGKVFNQLEVGGLSHGVLHYFSVSGQTGDISFADPAVMLGSLSSTMVADVSLIPKEDQKLYRTEPGDVLGLQIKVSSIEEPTPREALYNTSIVRTNQVLDAIKGKMVDTFTLWPDVVSCWRWERGKTKENSWNLKGVRWRFLMKNIFPDLSESLQALAIPGSTSRPRVNTIVAI